MKYDAETVTVEGRPMVVFHFKNGKEITLDPKDFRSGAEMVSYAISEASK